MKHLARPVAKAAAYLDTPYTAPRRLAPCGSIYGLVAASRLRRGPRRSAGGCLTITTRLTGPNCSTKTPRARRKANPPPGLARHVHAPSPSPSVILTQAAPRDVRDDSSQACARVG